MGSSFRTRWSLPTHHPRVILKKRLHRFSLREIIYDGGKYILNTVIN
jgi:hypothetical protein